MVAPQEKEVLWILDLVGKKKANCLQASLPSVNIVPQEQIVFLWRISSSIKDSKQVMKLAMDIPTKVQRRFQFQKHGLIAEDVQCYPAQIRDNFLVNPNCLVHGRPFTDIQQLVQDVIHVQPGILDLPLFNWSSVVPWLDCLAVLPWADICGGTGA